ncbi:MAG: PAS domain S-box protein [Planctomycetes bacterium]|nr:PAS domain S-box protein [Planctomycetota bacterium]
MPLNVPSQPLLAWHGTWKAYVLAAVVTVATVGLRLAGSHWFGERLFLMVFLPPILVSSFVGGLGPGLFATACCGLAALVLVIPPENSFAIAQPIDGLQWLALLAIGTLACLLVDRLHRARQRDHAVIEDLRSMQQQLKSTIAERSQLKSALDEHAIMAVTDAKGRILEVNDKFCAISQYTREELVGRDHRIINSGHHPKTFFRDMWATISSARPWHGEICNRAKDGSLYWVATTIVPFPGDDGKPWRYVAIRADITQRKQAEARITAQLARLDLLRQITHAIGERQDQASIYQVVVRSLEEQLPVDFVCMCLYDRIANHLTVSRVGVRCAGLAMELAMTEQAIIPIDRNGLSTCVQGHQVYEEDIAAIDFPIPRRLSGAGLGSMVATPLINDSAVSSVLITARVRTNAFSREDCEFLQQLADHTALAARHIELYSALLRAYEDLRQTQQAVMQHERLRALGQMASGIAHDINNALSPILICTEAMLNRELGLSQKSQQHLRTVERAAEDIASTVGRLREFYRPRDARASMNALDINLVVQQVVDLTRARWHDMPMQRGIVIDTRCECATGLPFVIGIDSELREALTNLVINAVDAMPDGGILTLRTLRLAKETAADGRPREQVVRVEVSDTGVGMDEQVRLHCLDPFFTTKGERGTGLGLAMVYGVLQRHGAEFTIDSAVGRGSTMRIDFTVLSMTATASPALQAATLPPLRLLLVDDDPLILKTLSEALIDEGHEVVVAHGGDAGISMFRSDAPSFDAVISDLGMPHVDGRKVAAAVKEASPTTPFILLTGWGQRLIDEGESIPYVDRVLGKPPRMRELRAALIQLTQMPP